MTQILGKNNFQKYYLPFDANKTGRLFIICMKQHPFDYNLSRKKSTRQTAHKKAKNNLGVPRSRVFFSSWDLKVHMTFFFTFFTGTFFIVTSTLLEVVMGQENTLKPRLSENVTDSCLGHLLFNFVTGNFWETRPGISIRYFLGQGLLFSS